MPGEDASPAAAGEVFAEMVRDRLTAEGLSAEVSTERYAKPPEQDRAVWAVWISTADESSDLVCEVAEGNESINLMDDSGADVYTRPDALTYIVGRIGGRTRKQARTAAREASRSRSFRAVGESG